MKKQMAKTFDLADYRTYPGAKVFSGRPRGETVRQQMGLDRLDEQQEDVTIKIPEDTYSFNMSFFLGLCTESVRRRGRDWFTAHYHFVGPEVHLEELPDYVEQAVKQSSVLHSALARK